MCRNRNPILGFFDFSTFNKKGKDTLRTTLVTDEKTKLEYPGPRTQEALWADRKFRDVRSVRVGTSRIMRYRPKFRDWSLEFELTFDPNMMEADILIQSAENAGRYIGLGDYRPEKGGLFGRFETKEI